MDALIKFTRRIVPVTATLFYSEIFPQSGSVVDLWFTAGRYYSSAGAIAVTDELSISRASIAYADTSSGTLTQFAADTLRITDLGLYVEGGRTNIVRYSQDLTQSPTYWQAPANFTISIGATAPDGTATANQLIESSDAVPVEHRQDQNLSSVTTGVSYAFSIYAKTNGRNLFVALSDNETGQIDANIDLINGTISGQVGGLGNWTNRSTSITAMANGWYRATISGTKGSVGTSGSIILRIVDSSLNGQYVGNGSSGIYVWGVQVEQGGFASSYIPTTTTSAARAADNILATGALLSGLSSKEATVVADLKWAFPPISSNWYAIIADPGSVEQWLISPDINVNNTTNARIGSVGYSATLGNNATFSGGAKCGFAWHNGSSVYNTDIKVFGGGGTVTHQSVGPTQLGFATISFGYNGDIDRSYFGWYRRVTVWNSMLPDSSLQQITIP